MIDSIEDDKTGLNVRFDDGGRLFFTYNTVILVAKKHWLVE
jgi:hypothetical protein